jgi:hypothetical protein
MTSSCYEHIEATRGCPARHLESSSGLSVGALFLIDMVFMLCFGERLEIPQLPHCFDIVWQGGFSINENVDFSGIWVVLLTLFIYFELIFDM